MDNLERQSTLGTQNTGRRQTQHRKIKTMTTRTTPKTGDELRCLRSV